jgi:hypothetical protein
MNEPIEVDCPTCGGTGKEYECDCKCEDCIDTICLPCPNCKGHKTILVSRAQFFRGPSQY